ncbi:hypothetical protein M569_03238 [Genlisea aurea]|uniref:AIPP2-like SPOC-like domain-containing protein n=1 Tax=Genlisea aurea TaxID=192259 RepID=S8D2A2_9LAMI|nr:hypothetical protein M569_03238 [Genlisea aurea]
MVSEILFTRKVEDEICLQCGDKGFENAFVYCTMCLHYVVHRYCLDVIPKTLDEFVPWVCDFCQDETLTSGLESDHPTTAHEFSRDETKGVVLDLELVDENGFKESVAESSCLDPIDEAGSRSDTGDGSKEALRSDLNDGNEENNLQVVIIKPESCVHDNGFDVESAVVPRDIRNGEAMRSKTNARRQFPGKGADPGCSSKHSQILASPLRGGHKRTHPEFYREQHFGRRRHSWEKRVKWNPASGEYHAATSTESSYSANANPSHVFRKPNDPDLSTAVSKDADPSSPAAPVAIPVWRACQKVHDAVSKFMPVLSVALFPKMDVWPKSFNSREPNGDSIALFFFPSRRSCGAFYDLIHDMLKENLALRSCVLPGAELLIFTSRELPHPYSSELSGGWVRYSSSSSRSHIGFCAMNLQTTAAGEEEEEDEEEIQDNGGFLIGEGDSL